MRVYLQVKMYAIIDDYFLLLVRVKSEKQMLLVKAKLEVG